MLRTPQHPVPCAGKHAPGVKRRKTCPLVPSAKRGKTYTRYQARENALRKSRIVLVRGKWSWLWLLRNSAFLSQFWPAHVVTRLNKILFEFIIICDPLQERLDFSCAMFGPDGGLVANAPHIPVHLGSMQETVQYQVCTNVFCWHLIRK